VTSSEAVGLSGAITVRVDWYHQAPLEEPGATSSWLAFAPEG